ncbi:putative transcriptional regulator [Belliella baltica DSM 15883]|uniref:Putative transcriptional regulator n=1 Tax=Belliella baltica (strain DSM 15883 / CIP 108006 / LMG 21964 / BA134) TaxID=866536 RepID=I3ZAB9_BELBD|nr:helix-turn-helix transcriptional regulator [Belliella baltica]AFL86187.1 putative transcriptional regulator [Belliella baltica DSM 15883]
METQYYHAVSKKIKELRALKGYTQEFVATVLEKKSYSNYQKIESGKTNLSILDAKKLAELYDIDVIEIINPEQSKGDKIFMNKNCNNYESKVKLNISIELDGSIENLEKSMEILKKINGLL